jgi:hypothetical protein
MSPNPSAAALASLVPSQVHTGAGGLEEGSPVDGTKQNCLPLKFTNPKIAASLGFPIPPVAIWDQPGGGEAARASGARVTSSAAQRTAARRTRMDLDMTVPHSRDVTRLSRLFSRQKVAHLLSRISGAGDVCEELLPPWPVPVKTSSSSGKKLWSSAAYAFSFGCESSV